MAETSEDMFSRMSTNVSPTSEVKKVKKPKVREAPVVETVQTKRTFCDKHPKMCMAGVKVATAGVGAARKGKEVAKATYRGSVKAGKKVAHGTYKAALVGTVVGYDVLSGDFAIANKVMKGCENNVQKSEEKYVSNYEDVRERLTGSRKRPTSKTTTVIDAKKRSTAKKKTSKSAPKKTSTAKKTTQTRKSSVKKKTSSKSAGTRKKSTSRKSSSFADPSYWRL